MPFKVSFPSWSAWPVNIKKSQRTFHSPLRFKNLPMYYFLYLISSMRWFKTTSLPFN